MPRRHFCVFIRRPERDFLLSRDDARYSRATGGAVRRGAETVRELDRMFGKFWSAITLCCKSLKPQDNFRGWEAGIRTPITWSRGLENDGTLRAGHTLRALRAEAAFASTARSEIPTNCHTCGH